MNNHFLDTIHTSEVIFAESLHFWPKNCYLQ